MRVEDHTHAHISAHIPWETSHGPWKTKTDGARTFQHVIDILCPEGKHLFEAIWILHKNTEAYTVLNLRLCCADIRLIRWQVQLSALHMTFYRASFTARKRHPWKLKWLCTKMHEKPTAASCLNAVLHEAVKYRRAGLKSCRWWRGSWQQATPPGFPEHLLFSVLSLLHTQTHTLHLLLPRQQKVGFLQIMERWPLRHLVETSVASQYSLTL